MLIEQIELCVCNTDHFLLWKIHIDIIISEKIFNAYKNSMPKVSKWNFINDLSNIYNKLEIARETYDAIKEGGSMQILGYLM